MTDDVTMMGCVPAETRTTRVPGEDYIMYSIKVQSNQKIESP